MRRAAFLAIAVLLALPAPSLAEGWRLRAAAEGGYMIDPPAGATAPAPGLADLGEIAAALPMDSVVQEIDFSAGQPHEGVHTITVRRPDGRLARFEQAEGVVLFPRAGSLRRLEKLTTLDGAVIFTLKIDNAPGARVARLEQGVITLEAAEDAI